MHEVGDVHETPSTCPAIADGTTDQLEPFHDSVRIWAASDQPTAIQKFAEVQETASRKLLEVGLGLGTTVQESSA